MQRGMMHRVVRMTGWMIFVVCLTASTGWSEDPTDTPTAMETPTATQTVPPTNTPGPPTETATKAPTGTPTPTCIVATQTFTETATPTGIWPTLTPTPYWWPTATPVKTFYCYNTPSCCMLYTCGDSDYRICHKCYNVNPSCEAHYATKVGLGSWACVGTTGCTTPTPVKCYKTKWCYKVRDHRLSICNSVQSCMPGGLGLCYECATESVFTYEYEDETRCPRGSCIPFP